MREQTFDIHWRTRSLRLGIALVALLVLLPSEGTQAASVLSVAVDQMTVNCDAIFEGRVTEVVARDSPDNSTIHTYITFAVLDVLKGPISSSTIELRFLGGVVGDRGVRVSDLHYPKRDEHGIYFVESLTRHQVHPLYGWAQGHFIVERDENGIDRVLTQGRKRVGHVSGVAESARQTTLSEGVAEGVILADHTGLTEAMSVVDFKHRVGRFLGEP